MTHELMIEVDKLTKFYGPIRAIENISFELKKGEILGFLGPNGAGKTTTMKTLTCYISPTSGAAKVKGHDVFTDSLEVRKLIGYLPENNPLYFEMTVGEYLIFIANMRTIKKDKISSTLGEVIQKCGLTEMVGREIRSLSKGYRQRVGLAQALLHDPEILILDEPTSGLDPNQIIEIRDLIKKLGEEKTVILSTHNLSEVEATCNRVIIVDKGKLVADGSIHELSQSREGRKYELVVGKDSLSPTEMIGKIKDKIDSIKDVKISDETVEDEIKLILFGPTDKDLRGTISKFVYDQGWDLLEFTRQEISLETIFHDLTQEGKN